MMKMKKLPDYNSLFINREFHSLLGRNKINLLICSLLLFISVFTISFSLGAFQQLKERMDNPFTNWVTMPVIYAYKSDIPDLISFFEKQKNLDSFKLKNLTGYAKFATKVIHPKNGQVKTLVGRTLDFNEEIAQKIFDPSNILFLKKDFSLVSQDNLFEYFVTEGFCDMLDIAPSDAVDKYIQVKDFESDYLLLFKIGGVLKSLPNHTNFIASPDFYNVFKLPYDETGFVTMGTQTKFTFLTSQEIPQQQIQEILVGDDIVDLDSDTIHLSGGMKRIKQTVYSTSFISDSVLTNFYLSSKNKDSIMFVHDWVPVSDFHHVEDPMYISFNFASLDKIRELQVLLKDKYKMEIELSIIEERDNFSMVSKMTYFMIISIIFVSLISFSIFLYNLIRNHLDKIKPNIGTFMAFGFSRTEISKIYSRTMMKFMLASWSFTLVMLVISAGILYLFSSWTLSIIHPIVILTFIAFNVLGFVLTKSITAGILNETPGDLIYNRV